MHLLHSSEILTDLVAVHCCWSDVPNSAGVLGFCCCCLQMVTLPPHDNTGAAPYVCKTKGEMGMSAVTDAALRRLIINVSHTREFGFLWISVSADSNQCLCNKCQLLINCTVYWDNNGKSSINTFATSSCCILCIYMHCIPPTGKWRPL